MYNQPSYSSQSGQTPPMPVPPPFQQLPPSRAPPPPHRHHQLQHGPLPHSVNQQAPPPVPSHVGQPGPSPYRYGPSPLPTFPRVPSSGMSNAGQSCFRYPPPFHGGTPLYPTTQQNSPHPTHFGNQNVYPVQQPVAPAYGPPPPPRMLPHSSQDQSSYRAPVLQSPQVHNGVQGSQHILLAPPPPPASSLSTSAPLIPSTGGNSRMPSTALPPQPPPPSSSPPLPPPPPPPTSPFLSSMAIHATPNLPPRSDSNPDSSKLSGCGLKTSSSIDENSACSDGRDKLPEQSGSQAGYLAGKGSLSKGNMILDLPPTPPKPREEKLVQRTEALCQSIAKNGSDFEDMALLKKSGNSQFEFMLGGEPGSEAAIAHDYFLWMKKKCNLTMLDEGNCDSSSKAFAVDDKKMMVVVGSHSPADSDMEMEDDITHPDTVQVVKNSFESQNFELDSVCINSNEKECAPHSSGECKPVEAVSAKISLSVFPGPGERSSSGAPECSPAGEAVKSTSFRADNRSPPSLAAAEGIGHSPQHINDGSPFRLLQGYASDDSTGSEDEPRLEDFKTVSSAVSVDATNLLIDSECNLRTYIGLESPGKTEKQFGLPSGLAISSKAPEISAGSQGEFGITTRKTNARGAIDEHDETMLENEALINCVTICEDIQEQDVRGGACAVGTSSGKFHNENKDESAKSTPTLPKVDEFGRVVREGASDSDSDDSHHRRHSKRGRSRSWSRSPPGRRRQWRRRSPKRRRERRSRSRSWSPRHRRSRSRSPSHNHAGEFMGDRVRRDKGQVPDCFDFLRGRCYRAAFCRYRHHDRDEGDGSRHYRRSKQQYLEMHPSSKKSSVVEEIKNIPLKASDAKLEEINMDMSCGSFGATESGNFESDTLQSFIPHTAGQLIDADVTKFDSSKEGAAKFPERQSILEEPKEVIVHSCNSFMKKTECHHPFVNDKIPSKSDGKADALISYGEASQDAVCPSKFSAFQQPQPNLSGGRVQNADHPQTDNLSISDSSANGRSSTALNNPTASDIPIETENLHLSAQLPPPQLQLPFSQGVNAPHMEQPPKDPGKSFPPYMLPGQQSFFSVPSTSLPPPPPHHNSNVRSATPGISSQFQQAHLPSRNNIDSQTFSRPYTNELATYSQVGDFPYRSYATTSESHQPFLHAEDFRLRNPPVFNLSHQQFGGPGLLGEHPLPQLPVQGFSASSFLSQSNNHPQPTAFSQEFPATNFHGIRMPQLDPSTSTPHIHPYSQQQLPPHGLRPSMADNVNELPGKVISSSTYPPDHLDMNKSAYRPDFGSRTAHHNPYASTFEQPLFAKFTSKIFGQEKDSIDGQGVGSTGLRHYASSPKSGGDVGQNFSRSGGDRNDPHSDSIEPSSNSFNKSGYVHKREPTVDRDIVLRLIDPNKPLDVEENNQKEASAVVFATSFDNEEFGETADAEVGAVENASPSDLVGNMTAGDVEIDQFKSPGKSKKSKGSRSMRLFKVAIADFVKDVLKPSWRQGNMSKEAFKTIVKKTVDKVSGAMKSHQIPKSQARINQYIDSSQLKLTKLVMGYVDKYVKA
ncbi:uncharacterized protein LOC120016390 isoform X1 [Tripterygium wilfordii]|nr:uncharacterized protein LOC120016390 isoform X1 [Tripterygium wilfordii]XP_038725059.1 uncharacterized protein LOC120016390 isoform X1 [Tripterygium wilfordii]XP_038725060.1 uncharacterized protein LOC120016390 isoform X1 [Tripterygium wilfordii]XP_038725061.1 uncharacterized protein LOC120016390 isoform X1 [Tripterygium wilfordii]XP_038725062.1 uncharacterized protein LOC120016390 isoform X1 [Tripterygium wilfordii]XP_038725063.1 uncharacterized protein LOC120016390 isoform X1 [Tripterygiu